MAEDTSRAHHHHVHVLYFLSSYERLSSMCTQNEHRPLVIDTSAKLQIAENYGIYKSLYKIGAGIVILIIPGLSSI